MFAQDLCMYGASYWISPILVLGQWLELYLIELKLKQSLTASLLRPVRLFPLYFKLCLFQTLYLWFLLHFEIFFLNALTHELTSLGFLLHNFLWKLMLGVGSLIGSICNRSNGTFNSVLFLYTWKALISSGVNSNDAICRTCENVSAWCKRSSKASSSWVNCLTFTIVVSSLAHISFLEL